MKTSTAVSALTLAGALVTALAFTGPASAEGNTERCYGVALKGQNDCKAGSHTCKGLSLKDYEAQSFRLLPVGECMTIKGSLNPPANG